ncbi:alpha/beta fold hydrolase [Pseudodonghicola flavimaris]|uniref:Alpha/beta hydrolase n=1 Tax=Pseudodonghicola flavimaris TaxID=3050036 RepID=A0ABT7F6E4_9RHOB|nr:alpha/beta hydrolase [Pseudodonghicola flavimaris]MDK3020179.1 alpha/beta hydrolase [Pseudodonghicola flavimaris]
MSGWHPHTSGGISYLERPGNGAVLVLLHGIGSQAASFTPLLPHLPADLRVIAWNAPGYAASTPLAEDWPVAADYARALDGFLDRVAPGTPVMLLGHSLGALMGASFAAARRDRVSHLTLASPALGHGMARGGALSAAAQTRLDDLERQGAEAFAAARAARLVYRPEDNPGVVDLVRSTMAQVKLPGYGQAARMLASGRLLDDAEQLTVPTDVIVGAEDQVTPPEGARRAHAALRRPLRGKLTLLPEAGHAIYQQAPAGFAAALELTPEPATP